MRPGYALLVALPVVAVAIAGCGGGGGSDTTSAAPASTATTSALSQPELVEQGDAICGEVNAAVGAVGSGNAEAGSEAAQVASLYSDMVDSLKNLGTPGETTGYPEFIAAAEALSTAEGEVKLASEREDTAALEAAETNASSALASFGEAAQRYGFKECGKGPSAPATSTTPGASAGEAESTEAPEGEVEPEAIEPEEVEPTPEPAPETGGAGGTAESGGTAGAPEGGGGSGGGSGGIGPG